MGMPALAATDHEGLYGAVRFYQACKAAGIKPIVGVELTVEPAVGRDGRVWSPGTDAPAGASPAAPGAAKAPGALTPDGHIRHLAAAATVPPAAASAAGTGGHHLVLLARDYAGWSNLCRIISAAHLEHPGEPPLARLATLAEHGGHLVALSGCRRGEIWSRLLAGDKAGARAAASVFHEIFGRDFFIELQHELFPDSGASLRALDLLAHELRLPTVATNDVHYTVKADAGLHDVLAAEAANQPLPNPLGRKNAELYLKSPAQMRRLFQRYPEAYANAGRQRVGGEEEAAETQVEVAALRDAPGVGVGLRVALEEAAHLRRALEVEFGVLAPQRVGQRLVGGLGGEHVVQAGVGLDRVVHVVSGHGGQAQLVGQQVEGAQRGARVGEQLVLQLDEEVAAEDLVEHGGRGAGAGLVAGEQPRPDLAAAAAAERDEVAAVLGERGEPRQRRLARVLQMGGADDAAEVAPAGVVARQQHQVVAAGAAHLE